MRSSALRNEDSEPKDIARFRDLLRSGSAGANVHVVLLGLETFDLPGLLRSVERGFPYRSFEHLTRNLALPQEDVAEVLGIPRRTLMRRKSARRFAPDESDRLLRLTRVFGKALELFDSDRDTATEWLLTGQRALAGATPLEISKTEVGAREVEQLIGRLEHGVFS